MNATDIRNEPMRIAGERVRGARTLDVMNPFTGGRVGMKLTRVPGSSQWYRGGVIAYDNRIKVNVLGIPQALIDQHGVISAPVADAASARVACPCFVIG